MSLSPGFPQGAPTLAEVLLQRTFARPPQPFVDGEFLEALEHADDQPAARVEISRPAATGASADSGSGSGGPGGDAPDPSSAAPGAARSIDVRV
jgi:hypothetical protein